jgi:hypothetical protein
MILGGLISSYGFLTSPSIAVTTPSRQQATTQKAIMAGGIRSLSFGAIKPPPEKPKFLIQLKIKQKLNKELYDEEFKDLNVKKEVQYTNYLHEQTRKIFLHDLDELKKKYKGSQILSPKVFPGVHHPPLPHTQNALSTIPSVLSKRTSTAQNLLTAHNDDHRLNSAGSLKLRP